MPDDTKTLAEHTERIVTNLTPAQRAVLDLRLKLGHKPLPKRPGQIPKESPESALLNAIFKQA